MSILIRLKYKNAAITCNVTNFKAYFFYMYEKQSADPKKYFFSLVRGTLLNDLKCFCSENKQRQVIMLKSIYDMLKQSVVKMSTILQKKDSFGSVDRILVAAFRIICFPKSLDGATLLCPRVRNCSEFSSSPFRYHVTRYCCIFN